MSFDFHIHPWTREFMLKNGPIVKACRFFRIGTQSLPLSLDEMFDGMADSDVEGGVILGQDTHATPNRSFKHYTIRNDALASIANKSRRNLVAFAGVDPNAGAEASRELKRAFVKLGMKGLKIHSSANSVYPNDWKKMSRLYEICQEYGAPVLFHTGTTGLGDCEIKFSKPEFLDDVCQRYPDLKVVMAHFGWPWSDVTVAVALRNPNVYIDVSGWKPKYLPASLLSYLNGNLQDRFLFGTDYPMLRHRQWVEDFEASLSQRLKPGVADKLLRQNAKRILGS
jgi:uncharacterized protein